ncbi:MAG: hypothetical protein ISS48_03420 [Candidatus Aenigmarchaeota archaeon]|nr:hypothetical protein [Candidatus Aenigmarchaeota archaeon]
MKGQALEMLSFLVLAITIIVIMLFSRTHLASGYGKTLRILTERQETEGLRSGLNSILQTTEPKTGRKMGELIGISSYTEETILDFGSIGTVDVLEELEWRLNSIYGENKWNVTIPPADLPFFAQVVIIVDTSASLCDDVDAMRKLPNIIEKINDNIKASVGDPSQDRITATVYMLPAGIAGCCEGGGGHALTCNEFTETTIFHCDSTNNLDCPRSLRPTNEEDWGRGLACVIDNGPPEGWNGASTKIGIILSDELTTGNEDMNNPNRWQEITNSLNAAINEAQGFMYVFPIKADTGIRCCPPCNCEDGNHDARDPCDICLWARGKQYYLFTEGQCAEDSRLLGHMRELMQGVNPPNPPEFQTVYELTDPTQVTDAISNIITEVIEREIPPISLGSPVPENKKINTLTVAIPIPFIGEYTNLYFYQWS